jgi:hypothetical protein
MVALFFHRTVKLVKTGSCDRIGSQTDSHSRGDPNGWRSPDNHGFDGMPDLFNGSAIYKNFLCREASLINHPHHSVYILNGFNHDWFSLKRLGILVINLSRKTDSSIPLISMVLFLLLSPATILILEGLTPSHLARNFMQVLLAAPSTGGEVNRIFKELL